MLREILLVRSAVGFRLLLLGGSAAMLLCGCLTPIDSAPTEPQLVPNLQEKSAAAADCNQEIQALRQFVADQESEPCIKQKIIEPLSGICATEGLGRVCIFTLDEGTSCVANGPQLPQCNRLAKMENQFEQLGAFPLQEVGTTIHPDDQ
jgi:hypothetical protein